VADATENLTAARRRCSYTLVESMELTSGVNGSKANDRGNDATVADTEYSSSVSGTNQPHRESSYNHQLLRSWRGGVGGMISNLIRYPCNGSSREASEEKWSLGAAAAKRHRETARKFGYHDHCFIALPR